MSDSSSLDELLSELDQADQISRRAILRAIPTSVLQRVVDRCLNENIELALIGFCIAARRTISLDGLPSQCHAQVSALDKLTPARRSYWLPYLVRAADEGGDFFRRSLATSLVHSRYRNVRAEGFKLAAAHRFEGFDQMLELELTRPCRWVRECGLELLDAPALQRHAAVFWQGVGTWTRMRLLKSGLRVPVAWIDADRPESETDWVALRALAGHPPPRHQILEIVCRTEAARDLYRMLYALGDGGHALTLRWLAKQLRKRGFALIQPMMTWTESTPSLFAATDQEEFDPFEDF